VISATNADLKQAIAAGEFRDDLYFRLNVVEIVVPPLRERPEDILPLARHFLERTASERGGASRELGQEAIRALLAHSWDGNVRELQNRVQRAVLVSEGPLLSAADLGLGAGDGRPRAAAATPDDLQERRQVEQALLDARGVVARAAEELGVSRQALYRKMVRLGIVLERRPHA
jgi:DNA-binding NtrC family response regulator